MNTDLNKTTCFRLFYTTEDGDQENTYFITDAPVSEIKRVVHKHKNDEFSTVQTVEKDIRNKGYFIKEIDMLEFDFNY